MTKPSAANRFAIANPIPEVEPVTSAVLLILFLTSTFREIALTL